MNGQTSLSQLTTHATLAQIESACHDAGELLESIGLDPVEHQNKSLRFVCQQRQWSETEVLEWVKKKCNINNQKADDVPLKNDLVQWSEYLQQNYHVPNQKRLQEINNNFNQTLHTSNHQQAGVKKLQRLFDQLADTLEMYYMFEKKKFHPILRKIETKNGDLLEGTLRKAERAVDLISQDQGKIKDYMHELEAKSHQAKAPAGPNASMQLLHKNIELLVEAINRQFEIEKTEILPKIQCKIDKIHL